MSNIHDDALRRVQQGDMSGIEGVARQLIGSEHQGSRREWQGVPAARPLAAALDKEATAAHYGALAAQAEDESREREALTDALAEVSGFLDAADCHHYQVADYHAQDAIGSLRDAVKYLRAAVDNLSERVHRLEGGAR